MKFCAIIIFCLFLGIAFSENSLNTIDTISANKLAVDTLTTDTIAKDTLAIDTLKTDMLIIDSLVIVDTLVIDTLAADTLNYDTTLTDSAKIKPGLHFFVSAGAQFINFKDRSKFQNLLNEKYYELYNEYASSYSEDSTLEAPIKQDFQTVNLAFPLAAGIIWQFNDMHSLGFGLSLLYDNESVILTDKSGEIYNFKYTLLAFPIFAEYRLQISPSFISLKNGDYFSLFLRYYWMLPPTEIYSSWGNAQANFDISGNGYGVFLGYRFWEWEWFSAWGEMGYLSIDVKSNSSNGIVNSWNLGGLSILVRLMF